MSEKNLLYLRDWLFEAVRDRASRIVQPLGIFLATDVGVERSENQDRVAVMSCARPPGESFVCAALSDGMGGMVNGSECAAMTLAALFHSLRRHQGPFEEALFQAVNFANERVFEFAKGKGGATLSAIIVSENATYVVNVGDSRVYSTKEQNLFHLARETKDDTFEELFSRPNRGLIQYVGIGEGLVPHIGRLDPDIATIYITSDGIHYLDQHLLTEMIRKAPEPKAAAERLVALARWFGGHDNGSIVALRPKEIQPELVARDLPIIEIWSVTDKLTIMIDEARVANRPISDRRGREGDQTPDERLKPKGRPTRPGRSSRRKKRDTSQSAGRDQLRIEVEQITGSHDDIDRE
ncbi:protein phosphatase 2C domain-containing protein [Salinarimonas sp.]|uniref:PP2C family protein-serine/threonine phosphatase n=1 Tax=Salinarimonas sp. TaxID=2766526 RepID=UPI0032D8D084